MMKQILENAGRSILLASVIAFGLSGMSHAAGAGDQVGEHGSMAGQGGPVSKQNGSGQSSSQTGSMKEKDAQREKLEEKVNKEKEQDRQHTLDPSQHSPSK